MENRISIQEITRYLKENIGIEIMSYVSGENWKIADDYVFSGLAVTRLRCAYTVVKSIVDAYGKEIAKSWLFGRNTKLNGEAPVCLIRYSTKKEIFEDIILVAKEFSR